MANTVKIVSVIASCTIFNWKPEKPPPKKPKRLAGTVRQYSKNAIPQLISTAFHKVMSLSFRCQYQANVIKMLDEKRRRIVFMLLILHKQFKKKNYFSQRRGDAKKVRNYLSEIWRAIKHKCHCEERGVGFVLALRGNLLFIIN